MSEPAWVARKAELDALDDGHGLGFLKSGKELETAIAVPEDFRAWAKGYLGQAYSLACNDGSFVDPVTRQAFNAHKAGRVHPSTDPAR